MSEKEITKKELIRIFLEKLKTLGVDCELIKIVFEKNAKVFISGDVYSARDHNIVLQTAIDMFGDESIIDKLIVTENLYSEFDNDDNDIDDKNSDNIFIGEDDDILGTEDMFRAIEDGIPYMPPTSSSFNEPDNEIEDDLEDETSWKKKKKKKFWED